MNDKSTTLLADDDASHRHMLATLLNDWGYNILEARDGGEAVAICQRAAPVDLILMDVRMPVLDGMAAMRQIIKIRPEAPIIIMTAYSEVSAAVDAIRGGAYDYLTKPLDFSKLRVTLRNALAQRDLARENATLAAAVKEKRPGLLGHSPAMAKVEGMIAAIAPSEATVLITGESGTGKELAAKAVHAASKRAAGPFVAVNCGAFTETLLASELFGHEKGAFTGADRKHDGLFAQAAGGSVFLDEVGEMPPAMQVRLLRVLQEREATPVGGKKPFSVDCRVIAATNRDLRLEMEKGNFREDLYYRLNVVSVHMPPLRERGEDIAMLAQTFAERFAKANGKTLAGIERAALERLLAWHWPGNVRELENTMERAVILMSGEHIGPRELPERMLASPAPAEDRNHAAASPFSDGAVLSLEEVEKAVILNTLRRFGNNKTETAKALGITRKTLHAKLNKYGSDQA